MLLVGCGRIGFDGGAPNDATCAGGGGDQPAWPMPNDPGSGLPNLESYTVSGMMIATDNVTGLVWEHGWMGSVTWLQARDYCASLATANRCWRLPQRIELVSLVDYSISNPAINAAAFPSASNMLHWTATTSQANSAWTVDFRTGSVQTSDESGTGAARCVTGGAAFTTRFTTDADLATDHATGLVWQRMLDATTHTFAEAPAYCAALATAGGGWRVPSAQELATIVDTMLIGPQIDQTVFPGVTAPVFWSRTAVVNDATHAWTVDFSTGDVAATASGTGLPVRCVR